MERVAERPASRPAGPRKVPTLSETIESNAWDGIIGKMRFQVSSGRIYLTLGLFILGFIVGRIRLFERMDEFRGRLNRWALLACPRRIGTALCGAFLSSACGLGRGLFLFVDEFDDD